MFINPLFHSCCSLLWTTSFCMYRV